MSNYLGAVLRRDVVPRVREWLTVRGSVASEHRFVDLDDRTVLLLVSRGLDASLAPGRFFRGTAVSPEHGAIGFGLAGWQAMPAGAHADPHGVSGEFVLLEWDDDAVVARRDVLGSVALASTTGDGFAAVSDSLLVLVDLRRWLGQRVTQRTEVLLARTFPNNFASQQISEETHVVEVAYAAAGRGVRIPLRTLRAEPDGPLLASRVVDVDLDPVETMRGVATFVARTMTTLALRDDLDVRLMLSGGYDSRVLLGGAVHGGAAHRLAVHTRGGSGSHDLDARAVAPIAEHYRLRLNAPRLRNTPSQDAGAPLALLASTTLGFYDTLSPLSTVRRGAITINGVGAEIYKGNWKWRTERQMFEQTNQRAVQLGAMRAQAAKGIRATGGDPRWADASELLYCGFRNGIHGAGNSIALSMTGLRPLHQVALAALGHQRVDGLPPRERRDRARLRGQGENVMAGLLALMDTQLAAMPYDRPDKTLAPDLVAQRLADLGGPLGPEAKTELPVHGSPSDVPAGPSALGLGVAEHAGMAVEMSAEHLMRLAERGHESVEHPAVRPSYGRVLKRARERLVDNGESPRDAGAMLGKLLTLAMIG